jgi:hypothetical protein
MYKYLLIVIFVFSLCLGETKAKQFNWTYNLIPTVGQLNNGKYLKAVVLGSSQVYSFSKFSHYNDSKQIPKRNTYAWWLLGLYFYGIIDAYVDYSLKNFPNQKEEVYK